MIVQAELPQGVEDLLSTLESEGIRSHVVVHLIGQMSGATPEATELRRLWDQYPRWLPLLRRALAIDEQSNRAEHPLVAIRLNNLAALLQATNRLAEAESLLSRGVEIFIAFSKATGHEHPHMQVALQSYCRLLLAMGLSEEDAVARFRSRLAGVGIEEL